MEAHEQFACRVISGTPREIMAKTCAGVEKADSTVRKNYIQIDVAAHGPGPAVIVYRVSAIPVGTAT
jgi:hypothetical protein